MKVIVSARGLKKALNTCNHIAPVSSAIADEKTGVLVTAKDNAVFFTSFDETSSVRVEVAAQVEEAGEVLVSCDAVSRSVVATFQDAGYDDKQTMVKLETGKNATLKVTGTNRISEGKSLPHTRNFPLFNPAFFVDPPLFDESKTTQFPVFEFMDGLDKVAHAASKDTSKLHLNCISLNLTDNEVMFAATDGLQIAEFRKAAEVQGLRGSFILGLKFASVAAKVVNPQLDVVDLYVEKERIFIKSGGTVLVSSLLNTTFPDYGPFMETKGLSKAIFPREEFLSVLSGMQPTADATTHRLVIDASSSGTAILSTASAYGEAESSDLEVTTLEDFVLHFDSTRHTA